MRRLMTWIWAIGIMGIVPVYAQQTPAATNALPAAKSWADNLKMSGDLRYRYESINDDSKLDAKKKTYDQQRDRIRARLGIEDNLSDTLKMGMQLATGGNNPVSQNQDLGDDFQKKTFELSQAYFDWTAVKQDANKLDFIGGKFANPFICVSDLVWYKDINPEGLAAKGQVALGDSVTLMANAGYLWAQQRAEDSSKVYAGQGAVKFQPTKDLYVMVGGSYYQYDNMKGYQVLDWQGLNTSYGNSTVAGSVSGGVTNKNYKYDYKPVEFFAELGMMAGKVPVKLLGQTVNNSEAALNKDGYLYGITIGQAKDPNTFELSYQYMELQKDAVVGAFTDSDRWGGGTDGKGSTLRGKYQITKNLQGGVTYFLDQKAIASGETQKDYNRLMVDLVFNF